MCVGWSSIERAGWADGWADCLKLCAGAALLVEGKAGKRNTFSPSSSSSSCCTVDPPTRDGGWLNESTVEVWTGFVEETIGFSLLAAVGWILIPRLRLPSTFPPSLLVSTLRPSFLLCDRVRNTCSSTGSQTYRQHSSAQHRPPWIGRRWHTSICVHLLTLDN